MKKNTVKSTESAPISHNESHTPTAAEVRDFYNKNSKVLDSYAAAVNAMIQLRDVTKTSTRTINTFSKETVRTYLQNIGSNEKNLRGLSRYLSYRSHIYFRMIKFFANMFCLDANSVIPEYDLVKGGDATKALKSYNDTLNILDKMGLQREILKANVIALREDVAFFCVFFDEETGLFLMNLDPDYCKIDGQYYYGDYSFSMDMSYWRSREASLEFLGSPLQEMYRAYQSSGEKWQHMEDQYAFCVKFRNEDYDIVVPPFAAMFNDLINLLDLAEIQAIADEQEIYKMVYLPMETIGNNLDDWTISPDLVIKYFQRLVTDGVFPDYTSYGIVPGNELKTIDFNNDQTTDTTKVLKATETVLNTAGGAEILNGSTIDGSTAHLHAMIANTEYAISSLLPQIQAWVNRFISYYVSNPCKVKFFPVSVYTKDTFKESLMKDAQYGLPTKLAVNSLNGFSAKDTLALNFLEEEVLMLHDKMKYPLSSSFTSTGDGNSDEVGAPKKSETEITDDGEASRDKRDKAE